MAFLNGKRQFVNVLTIAYFYQLGRYQERFGMEVAGAGSQQPRIMNFLTSAPALGNEIIDQAKDHIAQQMIERAPITYPAGGSSATRIHRNSQ